MIIGLVDGPLTGDRDDIVAIERFVDVMDRSSPAAHHAACLAAAIKSHCAEARFFNAVVFGGHLTTSQAAIAAALEQCAVANVDLILCSFGVPTAASRLATAVAAILERGIPIVASAPARGDPVYPANIDNVLSVQGDARCAPDQWSALNLPTARFGAHPTASSGEGDPVRGASAAAAHFAGHLAHRGRNLTPIEAVALLERTAAYHGRERRTE